MTSSIELGLSRDTASAPACLSDTFLIIDCGCCLLTEPDWRRLLSQSSLLDLNYSHLVKSLTHGLPETVRSEVWAYLSKAKFLVGKGSDFLYEKRLCVGTTACGDWEKLIERDLARTFPHDPRFSQRSGEGQTALFNILRAYSVYDPEVGYCQGMAFIAGLLYLQMRDEETAFWTFVQIMWQKDWRSMFR